MCICLTLEEYNHRFAFPGNDGVFCIDDVHDSHIEWLTINLLQCNEGEEDVSKMQKIISFEGRLCFSDDYSNSLLMECCFENEDLCVAAEGLLKAECDDINSMFYIQNYSIGEAWGNFDLTFNNIIGLIVEFIYHQKHIYVGAVTLLPDPIEWNKTPSFPLGIPDLFEEVQVKYDRVYYYLPEGVL